MSSLPKLTDRQRARLDEIEAELRERYQIVSRTLLHFEDGVRPGRGNDAWWSINDGERLAEGFLDVYGNGSYAVADLDQIHNGFDDDCPCEHCVAYRIEYES